MRLDAWLVQAQQKLVETGISDARLESQMLAAHALNIERSSVLARGSDEVDIAPLDALLNKRRAREPLAYILGWREFYGRRFEVGPGVLIPRQETETLIEAVLTLPESRSILDLGTGSGCIAITIALELPEATTTAVDISPDALAVARRNANALRAEVRFVQSDAFTALKGEQYDLIVSNPPYVGTQDQLAPEIRDFEPGTALFAGLDGMDFYRRIGKETGPYLDPKGMLLTEVGDGQDEQVKAIFRADNWQIAGQWLDLGGRVRVLGFRLP